MADFLSYKNVGVSQTEIWESSHGRIIEQWSRAELIDCRLERGSPEQRPVISAILGVILAIPGGLFVQHTLILLREGRGGNFRYEAAMLVFGLLGVWILSRSLIQKRYYLRVSTLTSKRKLIFSADTNLKGIREFLNKAAIEYELKVDESFNTATKPVV
jgi:hypothetical protein